MKRRITAEELNELTPEQKEHLREWWKPITGDKCTDKKGYEFLITGVDGNEYLYCGDRVEFAASWECLPLLDIGQLIELLRQKDFNRIVTLDYEGAIQEIDLCDVLWNAVKAII